LPQLSERALIAFVNIKPLNTRGKAVLILAAATFVIGLAVWPGCATPPLPTKRTPVHARDKDDFKIRKKEHPTRAEVVARLGEPDVYLNDIRVAGYQLNDAIRREIWLLFFIIPVNIVREDGIEMFYVEFDEQERVRSSGVKWIYKFEKLSDAGRHWLREVHAKEAQRQKR
jgi:hypothetical protein